MKQERALSMLYSSNLFQAGCILEREGVRGRNERMGGCCGRREGCERGRCVCVGWVVRMIRMMARWERIVNVSDSPADAEGLTERLCPSELRDR